MGGWSATETLVGFGRAVHAANFSTRQEKKSSSELVNLHFHDTPAPWLQVYMDCSLPGHITQVVIRGLMGQREVVILIDISSFSVGRLCVWPVDDRYSHTVNL